MYHALLDRGGARSGTALLGRLTLPSDFDVRRTQIDRIWGVEKDALDVSYVRVYEVSR